MRTSLVRSGPVPLLLVLKVMKVKKVLQVLKVLNVQSVRPVWSGLVQSGPDRGLVLSGPAWDILIVGRSL